MDDVLRPGALVAPERELYGDEPEVAHRKSISDTNKTWLQRRTPVIACGAGLFSDGYLNNIFGFVNTILRRIYPHQYAHSSAASYIPALVFVGEVVGIFVFGWTSDHWSRKWSLFISTVIIFVFAALSAGAYGAGGSIQGMFAALAAYRFLVGIGIGGEYPAGSVGAAESTGEIESGKRNRWFILFSNFAIDMGYVVAAIVATIVVAATGEDHLRAAWRIMLGIGVIPPLSLFYLRFKLQEPESFKRESLAKSKSKTPWWLIIKNYWYRLLIVAVIWFIYDFSSYAFSTYASNITANLLGKDSSLTISFAWTILLNFFYIPGSFAGAYVSDWIGPRKTLAYGVTAQAIIGFIMAGVIHWLNMPSNIAAFVVVYGLFLSAGELGPGDNIGLVASKTCPTAIRGQYYALAAAGGKIGAFVGTYVFPIIQENAAGGLESDAALQNPFWVASSLAILSAALAFWCLPEIGQDTIDAEDARFRVILREGGFDVNSLGLIKDADAMGDNAEDSPAEYTEKGEK